MVLISQGAVDATTLCALTDYLIAWRQMHLTKEYSVHFGMINNAIRVPSKYPANIIFHWVSSVKYSLGNSKCQWINWTRSKNINSHKNNLFQWEKKRTLILKIAKIALTMSTYSKRILQIIHLCHSCKPSIVLSAIEIGQVLPFWPF
jgi:hypothetical protein